MSKQKTLSFLVFFLIFVYSADCQLFKKKELISQNTEQTDSLAVQAGYYNDLCWKHRADSPFLAIEYGNKAFFYYRQLNDVCKQAEVLNKLGIVKRNLGQYSLALDNFATALVLADSAGCIHQMAYAFNNLGDINYLLEKFDNAYLNLDSAAYYFQQLNDSTGLAYNYNIRGLANNGQGNFAEALPYFRKSLHIRELLGDSNAVAISYQNMADCQMSMKLYDSAYIYLQRSLEYNSLRRNVNALGYNYLSLGKYHYLTGNTEKAETNLLSAYEHSRMASHPRLAYLAYDILHKVYIQKGSYNKAYETLLKAYNSRDSLLNSSFIQKLTTLELQFEFERRNRQQEIVMAKKQVQFELDKQRNYIVTAAIALLLLISIVVAFILYRNFIKLKWLNAEIQTKNEEISSQQNDMEQQNKLLTELNDTKSLFFNIIAHDLRNPFHGILLISNLVKEKEGEHSVEEYRYFFDEIQKSAMGASKLLENLLLWAKTQTGQMEFKQIRVNLSEAIDEVFEMSYAQAGAKKITLEKQLQEYLQLHADYNMLITILRNLVGNAIKYSSEKSKVIVKAYKMDKNAIIEVTDFGVGIKPESIEHLFKIEQKQSMPGTKGEMGSGLGLILTKDFMHMHKGIIQVESELGNGSIFRLIFPEN